MPRQLRTAAVPQKKREDDIVNSTPRVLIDTVTLASGTLVYRPFPATPTTFPYNYKRNPFSYSLVKVYGIRLTLGVVNTTYAILGNVLTGTVEIYKNGLNIFSAGVRSLLGLRTSGTDTAGTDCVLDIGSQTGWYSLGRKPLIFRDTEPFEVIITFSAMTSTDTLSVEFNAKTWDRVEKPSN